MKVPFSWLKDYVDIDISAEQLQEKLFSCGFEVEELKYLGEEIDRCVVGRIVRLEKHPDADKLQICSLDCGEYGGDIRIVTGADNVFEGALVPVALDGSSLHGGVKIKKGKLRGVESCGMLCSGEELGINEDWYDGAGVNGILILKGEIPVGTDIKEVVGLDDYLFDIAVTANRPDCQSVYGIAREVAAVLKKPLRPVDLAYEAEAFSTSERVRVHVEAPDLCPRYIAHYVRDLKIAPSPQWLRRRLALCGIRAISNVVDITNFVLLELGQPMHAFDLSKIEGDEICVRRAAAGEKIVTLDEKEFTLNDKVLVIADAVKPAALAGVMGGSGSGIGADTKEVLFESAKFERANIRRTSRALGQKSDSSSRFEKGVDAYTTGIAINRALHFIDALGCGRIACDRYDIEEKAAEPVVVKTSCARINALLGIEVPAEEIKDILRRLHFNVSAKGDALTVTAPAYREDIEGYPDLAEEVIRMYGYEHIKGTFMPTAQVTGGGYSSAQREEERIKRIMRGQGCNEIITYSFISPKDYALLRLEEEGERAIRIKNPIGEDMSLMRTTLAPSMLTTLVRNVRRGNARARLFESANVYLADEMPLTDLPREEKRLSFGVYGAGEDFYTAKGIPEAIAAEYGVRFAYEAAEKPFLHPGKCAKILFGGEEIGWLGALAPDIAEALSLETEVFLGELDHAKLQPLLAGTLHFAPLPAFPEAVRDLALVCGEQVLCADIESGIREACKYVTGVKLFDVYRGGQIGEGKKSMAFTVTFTPRDKAFSPDDVDGYVRRILKTLGEKVGVVLR